MAIKSSVKKKPAKKPTQSAKKVAKVTAGKTKAKSTTTARRGSAPLPATIRAWWAARQGLDGSLGKLNSAEILERTGWARSVGGVGPYLTFFSRAKIGRAAADAAVAKQQLHELPAARGCTYVVPASDFALALKVGEQFGFRQEMRVAASLGVTEKEIDKLCDAVSKSLAKNVLEPDEIRTSVGSASRNLGEAGKKKGLTTTLPVALGKLQSMGLIRRVPSNGRLDQQRYRYAAWPNCPLAKFKLSLDEAFVELALKFFRWIGPATLAEFRFFSALGVKASEQAVASLGLMPITEQDERLMFPDDLDSLRSFKPPKEPRYSLVSGLDSIHALRRNVSDLIDPADEGIEVLGDRGHADLGALSDLPEHAIFDRGRLIGLWVYDPETNKIVWVSWVKSTAALKAAVSETENFVRDQLGDARSFSLDSPKSRIPRINFLRKFGS